MSPPLLPWPPALILDPDAPAQQPVRRPSQPATRADITPWEFQTIPPSIRARASLPAGLVEQVTPWELHPAPAMPEPVHRRAKRSRRPSSSSGTNKPFADFGIGPRRKSTGSKAKQQPPPRAPVSSTTVFDSFSYHSTHSSSTTSFPLVPPSPSMPLKFLGLKKTSSVPKIEPRQSASTDPRFSTPDRKILEELKRNISAREAQFVKKGRSVSFGGNGVVAGKKHHPYLPDRVPYPRNYERDVLDLDVWETAFCHDACGSFTWHVFKTPPTRVLDLGCGTGSWIIGCAKVWKDCHFVGLDIVPLHPDLQQIGSPDLASRITWVQANFLEKLPFPDEEFDYVHVKRIALGVPEDKWDALLEELTRVMKPGAAFELIEEDLFFPGKQVDSDSDSESEDEDAKHMIAEDHRSTSEAQLRAPGSAEEVASTVLPATSSRPTSPVPIREEAIAEETDGDDTARYNARMRPPSSVSSQGTSTPTRPPLQVKTSHESWHQVHRPPVPKRSTSTLSLPTPKSVISPIFNPSARNANASHVPTPITPIEDLEPPDLPSALPKPTINPRDHTILEMIYTEMLSSRFINMSPLSLLGNLLNLHFKDLRTHPAIQLTFPPLPPRKYRVFGKVEERRKLGEDEKKEPVITDNELYACDDVETEMDDKSRFLSMQSLLQQNSPYISLDETRPSAFSPSTRVGLAESCRNMRVAAIRRSSRLPNGQLNLDLKTLNLHLTQRVLEVLACVESMWEWMLEEQQKMRGSPDHHRLMTTGESSARPRTSLSSNDSGRSIQDIFRERIADMTRDEFDELTSNFRFDMQDQYVLGYALRDRFDWSISLCLPPPDRIAFDSACEKWRNWEAQQRQAASAMRSRSSSSTFTRPRAPSNVSSQISASQIARAHSGQSGQSSGSSTLVPPQSERWDQSSSKFCSRVGDTKGRDASNESLHGNGRPRGFSHVSQIPPTRKLSRALKVFVGWKP